MKIYLRLRTRVARSPRAALALCGLLAAATLPAQIPSVTQPPVAPGPPPPDKVVATVDGHDITYAEYLNMLAMVPANAKRDPQLAIENVFIIRYLAGEGEKLKLADQSPLKEELEFQRMNVVAGAMVNVQRETISVPAESIDAYYKANSGKYEQARIKVIYVAYKPVVAGAASTTDDLARAAQNALAQAHSGTKRSEAEARTLAEEIVKKARSGSDFLALVEQYSEDPNSKSQKGDFGVIKHDSTAYPEDLKKAVFALQAGQVSDPVREGTGIYILRVEEKTLQPMSEVGADILQNLKQQSLNDWFTALNKRFKPEIKDPAAFVQAGGNVLAIPPAAAKP